MLSPMALGFGMGKWGKSKEAEPQAQSQGTGSSAKSKETIPSGAGAAQSPAQSTQSTTAAAAPAGAATPWYAFKSLYGLGALALGGAAVGTAYYRREDFVSSWKWGYEHMTFVRNLWDEKALGERLGDLHVLGGERNVIFNK